VNRGQRDSVNAVSSRLIHTLLFASRRLSRARNNWREAARVVADRWDVFLRAEAENRAFAFKSFAAALDAEEAAAAEIAALVHGPPALLHDMVSARR
jgi:hypothetical protein